MQKEKLLNMDEYKKLAARIAAEGCVLLENRDHALPLSDGTTAALFGRAQCNYYKSGTGSGGMVNTAYVTGVREAILNDSNRSDSNRSDSNRSDSIRSDSNRSDSIRSDSNRRRPALHLDPQVDEAYRTWEHEHPYDMGDGWGHEPWYQEEMPLSDELIAAAASRNEAAIVLIGRTAGEDRDNEAKPGSYYLTEAEETMLQKVTAAFPKTIVLLNTGNIMDMSRIMKYHPAAVMYIWQGGQEGGEGVLDILTGRISPSGKLPDTIAYDISDYPAAANFGSQTRNYYQEDIYVGYRYFETFAPEKILYPFGYGLSYTTFQIGSDLFDITSVPNEFRIRVHVKNTGSCPGREVAQLYVQAPNGTLGKAAISLIGYEKTKELQPGESQTLEFCIPEYRIASYDDTGSSGYLNAYVLEAGTYHFLVGSDSHNLQEAGSWELTETKCIQQLQEVLRPTEAFERLKAGLPDNAVQENAAKENAAKDNAAHRVKTYMPVPLKTIDTPKRRLEQIPAEIPYTGDRGYKLKDVAENRISMDDFLAQLSDHDLCCLARGEGMNSPKVTPGTGGSYGGMTGQLVRFGIPTCCCSDGPSGIRMDCGTKAFSMPNGTCMAATFDNELIEAIYYYEGLELRKNKIELLLGPGINLHRHPLNGRNFEYFSEDPLLTGRMAAAQIRGMKKAGVSGVIKHFAGNNQEYCRRTVDSVISERALRELYLKTFEIAIKESQPAAVMTSYNPVNGQWSAGNFELVTTVLRKEWGFDGFVMTDWWAELNDINTPGEEEPGRKNLAAMIRAQNDVYMVVSDSDGNSAGDNLEEALKKGTLTRAELQRTAKNICRACIGTLAYDRLNGKISEMDECLQQEKAEEEGEDGELTILNVASDTEIEINPALIRIGKNLSSRFEILADAPGQNTLTLTLRSIDTNPLSQIPLSIFMDRTPIRTITLNGSETDPTTIAIDLGLNSLNTFYLRFYSSQKGLEISRATLTRTPTPQWKPGEF